MGMGEGTNVDTRPTGKRTMRRFVLAALTGCTLLGLTSVAAAQEIQLTGPLAGAPAVRKLRGRAVLNEIHDTCTRRWSPRLPTTREMEARTASAPASSERLQIELQ